MSRGIRMLAAAVAVATMAALAGCAGLPTDGRVQPGVEADPDAAAPDFSFRPPPPPDGASPEQIVEGFLDAGLGPASGWAVARQYLAEDIRQSWDPTVGVTVAVPGTVQATQTGEGQVSVSLLAAANVDSTGLYELASDAATTIPFSLAQQDDGEWRIAAVPDGIVLGEDSFPQVFRSYTLAYWDPTWTTLVPDVRWFPRTNPATLIAQALIDGSPSPWLAGAAVSAFPDGVELRQAVPVESTVAQVELGVAALSLDRETQARMQTQLEVSLASAAITGVQMSVSGTPLDPGSAPYRSTDVATQAMASAADGFGAVSGARLAPIASLDAVISRLAPDAIQVSADLESAAVRLPGGAVARVRADDEVLVADERAGLVAPTLDPEGWLWSVPADQPAAVIAASADGAAPVSIATAWLGATAITAMRVSRDGARIAAIVTTGDRDEVWVAGVVRDEDGAPVSLDQPYPVAELDGTGVALDWLDATTVGALTRTGDSAVLRVQTVGGPGQTIDAPTGSVQLAGANQRATVRVLDLDGVLYTRRGSTWGETLSGVSVLAVQTSGG